MKITTTLNITQRNKLEKIIDEQIKEEERKLLDKAKDVLMQNNAKNMKIIKNSKLLKEVQKNIDAVNLLRAKIENKNAPAHYKLNVPGIFYNTQLLKKLPEFSKLLPDDYYTEQRRIREGINALRTKIMTKLWGMNFSYEELTKELKQEIAKI